MKSDGGFDKSKDVKASQLLLSGPAGGLIGCQSIIGNLEKCVSSSINSIYTLIKIWFAWIWVEHQLIFPELRTKIFQ